MSTSTVTPTNEQLSGEILTAGRERPLLYLLHELLKSPRVAPRTRAARDWLDAVIHTSGASGGALCLTMPTGDDWCAKIGRSSSSLTDSFVSHLHLEPHVEIHPDGDSELAANGIGCLVSYPMISQGVRIGTMIIWFSERHPSLLDLTYLDLITDFSLDAMRTFRTKLIAELTETLGSTHPQGGEQQ